MMAPITDKKYPILTDKPASRDTLDFQPYIDSLAELIKDSTTDTPLTIGIFGQWGSGKTSLMQFVKQQIEAEKIHKTVWFNAWKYEREELALWRVLILRTLDVLRRAKRMGRFGSRLNLRRLFNLFPEDEAACFQTLKPEALRVYVTLPVTNLEYKAFIDAQDYPAPTHWEGRQFPADLADHPVTYVSWEDAAAYCTWLAETTGKPYRLPSEAEWERAARRVDRGRYPWGEAWEEGRANTREAGLGTTTPVGQYSPEGDSPAGCADMIGNVWEWTASDFEPYPGSAYEHTATTQEKVLRGGSFYHDKNAARTAFRGWDFPNVRVRLGGFRVAVEVVQK